MAFVHEHCTIQGIATFSDRLSRLEEAPLDVASAGIGVSCIMCRQPGSRHARSHILFSPARRLLYSLRAMGMPLPRANIRQGRISGPGGAVLFTLVLWVLFLAGTSAERRDEVALGPAGVPTSPPALERRPRQDVRTILGWLSGVCVWAVRYAACKLNRRRALGLPRMCSQAMGRSFTVHMR